MDGPRPETPRRSRRHDIAGPWLADTNAIAAATGRRPATIRSWQHRGLLTRRNPGEPGPALYDVEEAEQLAARIGPASQTRHRVQH